MSWKVWLHNDLEIASKLFIVIIVKLLRKEKSNCEMKIKTKDIYFNYNWWLSDVCFGNRLWN